MSWWQKTLPIRFYLQSRWATIPLLGGLAFCSAKDHAKASKEFFVTLLFSTVTFWLSAFVLRALTSNAGKDYFDLLKSTTSNGELLIFSVSFLGPILLASLADRHGKKQFPSRDWHVVALVIVALISAILFASIKLLSTLSSSVTPGLLNALDMQFLVETSFWLAGGAAALRYLTIVYQKNMLASDELLKNEESNFSDAFAVHRSNTK